MSPVETMHPVQQALPYYSRTLFYNVCDVLVTYQQTSGYCRLKSL